MEPTSGCGTAAPHMVVWSHRNVSNAITDLRTMLQMQKPNGMIPEMIFWGADDAPWWRRKLETFWYSNPKTTDITQMPNLPFSLRAIYAATNDTALLREFVPPLVRYLDWWADTRDLDGNGLVAIMHGWESGIDASPAYDIAYGITDPSVSYFNLYPRLLKLLLSYKYTYGWDVGAILARRSAPFAAIDNWFVVMDVGVNSVYAAGWGVLAELAGHFDPELAKHCAARAAVAEAAILRHCWSESLGRFVSLYKDRRGVTRPAEVEVAQSLFPLLLPSLPRERAESIVRTQLTNPDKFWLQYPIPSASKDAKQYRPGESKLLWRGPTWPILNWFVMEGLQRHGYSAEQEQLMDRWLQLYESRGVYEQYNPETGDAFGAVGLGMSTLIVDWLYRMGRMGAGAPPA